MSPAGDDHAPRRRRPALAWILAGGVAAHALLAWWFGERAKPVPVVSAPEPLLDWLADPGAARAATDRLLATRPTLFVLPAADNFSGPAWMRPPTQNLEYTPWTQEPQWLPLRTNELGADLQDLLAQPRPASGSSALPERLLASTADILLVNDPLPRDSTARVEVLPPQWTFLPAAPLPNPPHPDVLTNTVARLTVGPDGWIESAIVSESCGAAEVDHLALQWLQQGRFQRDDIGPEPGPVMPGRMVFYWLTTAPPPTNAPARTP